ncbi:hairy/enhancer-of-split related with YRPW motif protein 2-like [Pecten maximus]|uniref:hairy/enhancer-of-split related with YRPW motif protein 2-like n=1 Tax=Pecten maximus TaxID=6579 RepID=UPI001458A835|nr:hairy/enhancer-of-split related with YRPW motif protein 2-like [Pecten maximus]
MDSTDSEGNEVFQEKIKVPKHLIEKKRRARINNCLGELKKLVIEKDFLKGHRSSKLEKADILELTVEYLKRKAKPPYPVAVDGNTSDVQTRLYKRGYRECLEQVSRHLKTTGIEQSVSNSLLAELETVAQKVISKDSRMKGTNITSSYAETHSHTSVPKHSAQSDGPHHHLKCVASTTETHLATSTNSPKEQSHQNFKISPKAKEEIDQKWQMAPCNVYNSTSLMTDVSRLPSASMVTDVSRLPSASMVTDVSRLPSASMVTDVSRLPSASMVTDVSRLPSASMVTDVSRLPSASMVTDVSRLPSASIKSPREQMVHVDTHDVPSMCPVFGGLQSLTVLVPCQVLASAIPQINTTQHQTLGHICEHAELRSLGHHPGYSNAFSVNASCVSVNTQSNTRDIADVPLKDKYGCPFESIPLQSPWRPW